MWDAKRIYDSLPPVIQHLAVSVKGWQIRRRRFGGGYDRIREEVHARGSFSADQLERYRRTRLDHFLKTAHESDFWRRRFDEYDVDPDASDVESELRKLPILTKRQVKRNVTDIRPPFARELNLVECHTSGTTGSGLQFWQTREAEHEQWAVWWRYRRRHGITPDTWCGYFGGRTIVPVESGRPPYWRKNVPGKQILFSTYHLSAETAEAYLDAIRRYKLPWLHGYPSAIALFANFVLEHDLEPPECIEIVTTGAENLFGHQRRAIQKAFGVPVRQHYGLEEAVANVSECPAGSLHVDEDFAYVEFVPVDGEDDVYRLVGTNWSNPAFPLLRYDTGDLVRLADGECECGVDGRVVEEINGRCDDYVVLPDGSQVGRLDHIFKDATGVHEAQIYQPDQETVVFRIVASADFSPRDEQALKKQARKRLGTSIGLEFRYVDDIERTSSGKMKLVVSDIDGMGIEDAPAVD